MTDLTVFAPGTEVLLTSELRGTVLAVQVRGDGHVSYDIAWWDGKERKSDWLEAHEVFKFGGGGQRKIGFVS